LTQSQSEREAGDLGGAAATVERALTISPDEAVLWMELAEIRMAQGDFALAEEMARKALTLTDPNSVVAERARRLIGR
jgi:Flp pilus assembly protein TadD